MPMAINSNAGSEYEINEVKYVKSDREYRELIRYVREHGFKHAGDVYPYRMMRNLIYMEAYLRVRQQIGCR